MQQSQGQFTPEQLVIAGRRAESQGQAAYALQFYRYIADQFPSSTEAYEARDAIYRLSPPVADPPPYAGPPTAQGFGAQKGLSGQAAAQHVPELSVGDPRSANGLDTGAPVQRATPGKADKRKKRARTAAMPSVETDIESPERSYRIGRVVAAMLNTMGWLMFIAGLVISPLIIAALTMKSLPKGLRDAIAGNLLMVGGGTFGLLLLGLFAIFAAQTARATFDTADTVRYLLYGRSSDQ